MTDITIFQSPEFGNIRTMRDERGEVLFCGRDVAKALGYKKPENAIAAHVDDEDKTSTLIQGSGSNYKSKTIFINESGLYSLILRAQVDTAKRFTKWVTSEVLPSIRKEGGYMMARPEESDEVIMARALQIMHATLQRRDALIETLRPRAEYADEVLDSVSCLTTTQVAKGLGMTAQELNRRLCQKGIQYGQSGQYLLYAPYARQGLAQNRTRTFHDLFGTVHTTTSLVWTEKGRYFIHELLSHSI